MEMVTQHFVVNKTSFDMFDVFRAYGLAYLIGGFEKKVITYIHDNGYAFIIEVDGDLPAKPDPKLFEETGSAWSTIFRTFKERKDLKMTHPRKDAEEIVTQNYQHLLDIHRKYDFLPQIGKKVKDGRTLYQTLDVSAAKGYREEKRDIYHEGTQIEVDKYSWAVAVIGAAWSSVWPQNLMRRDMSFLICIVPNPKRVLLISHRDVQNRLDKRLCGISANTALIHYSVKLVQLVREKSDEVEYDNVVFNVMQKTGQQPKPGGGGKYSLDLLEKLTRTQAGRYAIEKIDKYLLPTHPRTKGIQQDVALALTDFLLHPTLENFRTFENLYIRGQANKKLYPWEEKQLGEILKYVEVA
jgi:hypothetical protein